MCTELCLHRADICTPKKLMISMTQTLSPGASHGNAHRDMKWLPFAHHGASQTWLHLEFPGKVLKIMMLRPHRFLYESESLVILKSPQQVWEPLTY